MQHGMTKMGRDFVTGNIVDIHKQVIYPGKIHIRDGIIKAIEKTGGPEEDVYILPGLVDSHIHIESSMVSPQQFAIAAIRHGTVGTVSDPHEIANVLGEEGIRFMLESADSSPLKFHFGVPSCVPATPFETSGAVISSNDVERMIGKDEFYFLSEMMNFPGVIHRDDEVMRKIKAARMSGKPVDGHAPGLQGNELIKYIDAGISTDHESITYEEAKEKIERGMKIQIREGSAAKSCDTFWPLIQEYPDHVMLCSDDCHPDDLKKGHINLLVKRGLQHGIDIFSLMKAASYNPVVHYNLKIGLLRENDPADFIVVDDLDDFHVTHTYIDGRCCCGQGESFIEISKETAPNIMNAKCIGEDDLQVPSRNAPVRIIQAKDGELFTSWISETVKEKNGMLISDTSRDILKIAVISRYRASSPAVGFIQNFRLERGAIGSSIAHDSHNLIAVGTEDKYIVEVVNWLIDRKGGIAVNDGKQLYGLPLEAAGLMSLKSVDYVAEQYDKLTRMAAGLGSQLYAPFMTLSFMALPVIPELKITDRGLFDVNRFQYTDLYLDK